MDSTLVPAAQMQASGNVMSNNSNNNALTPGASGGIGGSGGPAGNSNHNNSNGNSGNGNGMMGGMNYGDTNYDFFDPQHWMLDGLLDFNYSFVQPLEGT